MASAGRRPAAAPPRPLPLETFPRWRRRAGGSRAQGAGFRRWGRGRAAEGSGLRAGEPRWAAPARLRGVALRAVRQWRGEGTGGADGRVEGGKRASGVPVRAAAARRPPLPGVRRCVESSRADPRRQRGAAPAAPARPPPASPALPSRGPAFLSTPGSRRPQSLPPALRKPRRRPGPSAGG